MSIPSEFSDIQAVWQTGSLRVSLAATETEVEEAIRFRHDILCSQMKANLVKRPEGGDLDEFDRHCLHLTVRDCKSVQLVGSTRLLFNEGAAAAGMFYLESEFEFNNILKQPGCFMEVGRPCLRPGYRGDVAGILQAGVLQQVAQRDIDYVISCASLSMGGRGAHAQAIIDSLRDRYFLPKGLQVTPRLPLTDSASLPDDTPVVTPTLLKTYLAAGGMIGGEACWNPEFNVADVFILTRSNQRLPRHASTFLECA